MNKFICSTLALVFIFGFGGNDPAFSQNALRPAEFESASIVRTIQRRGSFRVALLAQDDYPPFFAVNAVNSVDEGLDSEVALKIAKSFGANVRVEYIRSALQKKELFSLLERGEVDAVICSLTSESVVPAAFIVSNSYFRYRVAALQRYPRTRRATVFGEREILGEQGTLHALDLGELIPNLEHAQSFIDFTVMQQYLEKRALDIAYMDEFQLDTLIHYFPQILLYYKPLVMQDQDFFQRHLLVKNRDLLIIINSVLEQGIAARGAQTVARRNANE